MVDIITVLLYSVINMCQLLNEDIMEYGLFDEDDLRARCITLMKRKGYNWEGLAAAMEVSKPTAISFITDRQRTHIKEMIKIEKWIIQEEDEATHTG